MLPIIYYNLETKSQTIMRLQILTERSRVEGCSFIKHYKFDIGHTVPIYDVSTMNALNQIIGHVKFQNANYGNVFYRGVGGLYKNVLPALMRERAKGIPNDLCQTLNSIINDSYFKEFLKLFNPVVPRTDKDYYFNKMVIRYNKYCAEALLQHYAGSTRFLDVVDNHWVALWMGLHEFKRHGKGNKFYHSNRKSLSAWDLYEAHIGNNGDVMNRDIYTYILLIAMPYPKSTPNYGISETEDFVEVDLRKALPSIYLRPHAQHALVIRRRDKGNIEQKAEYYDMASQVTAILRVRIDRVAKWLGEGILLTQENLFPSPSIDQGYNNLLMHSETFKEPFDIKKYF